MNIRPPGRRCLFTGFSLVEVVLAIGILAFGILAVVALLPVGLKQNQSVSEQLEAAGLLTAILADLQHSEPALAESVVFGISPLPLVHGAFGRKIPNPTLLITPVSGNFPATPVSATLRYFDRSGRETPTATPDGYRMTLRYTRAPGIGSAAGHAPVTGSLAPVEAHLMISWPATIDPLSPTENANLRGEIEAYATFRP